MSLLLWSGGCDSTLILIDMLRSTKNRSQFLSLRDNRIRTIAINHPQVAGVEHNKEARKRMFPLLRKRFGWHPDWHSEVDITHDANAAIVPTGGIIQPALWVLYAIPYLEHDEDLYAGYIRSDDVWHHRDEFIQAFDGLQRLTNRIGKLIFPLEWKSKADVIHYLRKERFIKHPWYCELPVGNSPCKHCASCMVHLTAVWQLQQPFEFIASLNEKRPSVLSDEEELCDS